MVHTGYITLLGILVLTYPSKHIIAYSNDVLIGRLTYIYSYQFLSLSLSLSLFFLFSLLLSLSLSSLRPVILPHWGPFGEGNDDASLFLFPLILSRSYMLSDATLSDPQLSWTLLYSLTPCYAMLSM